MALFAIENLTFTYPGSITPALVGINLDVNDGEFLVLCGQSGCGKSTLLRHLKGALTPHGARNGSISFKNVPLDEVSFRAQTSAIGYVLQNPENQIVTDKVWHELAFGLESLGYENAIIRLRVAEMASFFGIQDWYHKSVYELSGGQKQLLNLASVMTLQPDVLILDEPTSQLDPIAAADFLATIHKINNEIGTTIILSEHRLEEVLPGASRVIVMNQGQIACEGSPAHIGHELKRTDDPMLYAMPTPMRTYLALEDNVESVCPVTVRDGRDYLQKYQPAVSVESAIPVQPATSMKAGIPQTTTSTGEPISTLKHGICDASDCHDVYAEHESLNRGDIHDGYDCSDSRDIYAEHDRSDSRDIYAEHDRFGGNDSRDISEHAERGSSDDMHNGHDRRQSHDSPIVTLKNIWFRYEKNASDILRGLHLTVYRGEMYCIVGGNGTGKTTALGVLSGLYRPYRGKAQMLGVDITKSKIASLPQGSIAVLPQDPQTLFTRNTIKEDLMDMTKSKERIDDIAELTEITDLLEMHPYDVSGGEQQRAALAKVLLTEPKLLLMDEPTKGMDSFFKRKLAEILRNLRANGMTVILVSHDLEFCAMYADRCALFFDGSIVTENVPREFFSGNSFYTTAANRMSRHIFEDAITVEDVIEKCQTII
ncbi:MAG: ATP-binding cassette domain-containing protein [Clostridiales Family XIII bacterium]|jgi:energy-coupling factor transport system ATP-binding protein|nr:ATP-binding cassette domain-containing protein [Clostridiales Family XIII bacterium]